MEIVVVGCGKVGYTLTEWLLAEDRHNITVIDTDPDVIRETSELLDAIAMEGNGADRAVLLEAGADTADIVIAATSSDEVNLLCCFMARIMGAKYTVARVRSPEYYNQLDYMKEDMGLGLAVNPERSAASYISRIIKFPAAMKIDTFAENRVEMVEFNLGENNKLAGLSLREIRKAIDLNFLVAMVQRGDDIHIPGGDFVLVAGDRVTVSATPKTIGNFFKSAGMAAHKIKNAMIVGGSKMAYYLARMLIGAGVSVKIFEQDEQRCYELCELLPEATVINGDGSDPELLDEEGIEDVDAFVALTGFDEENIIVSIYASKKKVDKVIAKVNRSNYLSIVSGMEDIGVVSPKDITASEILRYVRSLENSEGSSVETLHKLGDNSVEALEFIVRKDLALVGQTLRDLPLRDNTLIVGIVRSGNFFVPGGADAVELGDRVLVVTTHKLHDLKDIVERGQL